MASASLLPISSENKTYQYRPLESEDSIRLITVLPSFSKENELRCEIEHVRLSRNPQYEALSYNWGDQTDLYPIKCNGYTLKVGKNLFGAFLGFRNRFTKRVLWADAICINQADIPEKNRQVAMMDRVYSQATAVRIWLGPKQDDDRMIYSALCVVYYHMQSQYMKVRSGRPIDVTRHRPQLKPDQWAALHTWFNRPWFSRVWILQEAVLAPKALLHWGEQRMKLETATTVVEGLGAFQHMESVFPSIPAAYDSLCFITVKRMERRGIITDSRLRSIVHLLDGARGQKATDPRDKVYALLGLMPNPMGKQTLVPDYSPTCSVEDVFINAAVYCLFQLHDLRVLSYKIATIFNLPSWVPDWTVWNPNVLRPAADHFCAGTATPPTLRLSPDRRMLTLRGRVVAQFARLAQLTVSRISGWLVSLRADHKRAIFEANRAWLEEVRRILTFVLDPYPCTGQPRDRAFAMTLICDSGRRGERATAEDLSNYDDLLRCMNLPIDLMITSGVKDAGTLQRAQAFQQNIQTLCQGRRFCLTMAGEMGWVPEEAGMADIVVLFAGSPDLHVLRRISEDRFYIVGHCYLHGLMHGEVSLDGPEMMEFSIV
ncbi:HET-domain-containing protein [Hyaloscypha variabilis F]|uniref:HET-domain-containing protein n=1 Tax=Hyaloscypha variabilis (strain UAMH 11265 / GT02V1 / F) TaxID=1149755 RepID=A0A2J6QR60_HYAVF|nr:HET-domain-containing protein [Hyaloscypha variabilis F]